jgi:hypothetical protein
MCSRDWRSGMAARMMARDVLVLFSPKIGRLKMLAGMLCCCCEPPAGTAGRGRPTAQPGPIVKAHPQPVGGTRSRTRYLRLGGLYGLQKSPRWLEKDLFSAMRETWGEKRRWSGAKPTSTPSRHSVPGGQEGHAGQRNWQRAPHANLRCSKTRKRVWENAQACIRGKINSPNAFGVEAGSLGM